ncbi:MAG: hypothetical protein EOO62_07095 [Hymenobacter sp.]|nr:MAG: hypothetical protein EOO62_07095 [Hymenobacter sp.]
MTSGKLKRNFYLAATPGSGYALHFYPPAPDQRALTGIALRVQPFGRDTARGRLRIRVASVAPAGGPADDDLLPASIVLTDSVLQAATKPFLLAWQPNRVLVPATGFFVVVEGMGDAADEYATNSPATAKRICSNCYTIGRRNEPNAPLRLLPARSVPKLPAAKPTLISADYWVRGGHIANWQRNPATSEVPLLELFFE